MDDLSIRDLSHLQRFLERHEIPRENISFPFDQSDLLLLKFPKVCELNWIVSNI